MKDDYAFEWRLVQLARERRRNATAEENEVWSHLRNKRLGGYKFRRQHPIKRFIVDFYCHQCQLIIEIDGMHHNSPSQHRDDVQRDGELSVLGYLVLRFSNERIRTDIQLVCEEILTHCQARRHIKIHT